ncbi:DUF4468 domain-containing protein [Halosquirtibacter xylanolyticus]|uniref:DUF4468 domain-containing protein n=1 Tax=Halosquirtibacter xylanolyticus TaxID=3374599 RepID=UPI00374A879C|nr:DUF4468 domain-containing protein [Prolixibacteraceae bacterium]
MQHLFTIVLLLLRPAISFTQNIDKLILTSKGFISKKTHHDYIILKLENQTKETLYKKSLICFNSIYKSPKDVISKVDNELITIHEVARNCIRRKRHEFNMDYSLTLRFKDGKIKIEQPHFELTSYNRTKQTLHLRWDKFSFYGSDLGIYGRKNKIKSPQAKKDLEHFFNEYIEKITINLSNSDSDNW